MRRIKSATITAIALCRRGKNGLKTLMKADGTLEMATLTKAGSAGELLSVVYAPIRPDADADFADAPTIKSFAHKYLRDHRALDIEHDGKKLTNEQAYIAESFIVAKGDTRFQDWKDYAGNPVGDLTGAWATITQIDDPTIRKAFENGELDGVSMFGTATVETVSKSADERAFERMAEQLRQEKESQMTPEQLAQLAKSITEGVTGGLALLFKSQKDADDAAKAAAKAEADKIAKSEPTKPVFKGDVSNKEAREAFVAEMRAYELSKAVTDGKSADEIAEMFKALDEGEISDEDAKIVKTDGPVVRDLKRKLAKAERRSNQGAPKTGGNAEQDTLAKAETDGLDIANIVNSKRGYTVKS